MYRLMKVISWRVISIFLTLLVMWIMTGSINEATGITVFLHVVLVCFHWLFETAWERFIERTSP